MAPVEGDRIRRQAGRVTAWPGREYRDHRDRRKLQRNATFANRRGSLLIFPVKVGNIGAGPTAIGLAPIAAISRYATVTPRT
jgi:hypothetical protein